MHLSGSLCLLKATEDIQLLGLWSSDGNVDRACHGFNFIADKSLVFNGEG